jgi:bifunctional enzyme CysN/CysC
MRHDLTGTFVAADNIRAASAFGGPVATVRPSSAELSGIIRLLTCGSVDDGKSTLIGRLLWDASPLYDDQREKLLKETASLNGGRRPDFSRLVDGLIAEQEQGITIDIAWHYFDTRHRRFVIIDSPGHEQYTRNMATGASHADAAVLLVDAQSGIKKQTRRHLAILDLAGVRNVVLAVNKMDLAGWSEAHFESIASDFETLAAHFPALSWVAIPVSALNGDNVATRSQVMSWYSGPTFVQYLETVHARDDNIGEPFRMPVQMVLRDGNGFRGLAGTVTSGRIGAGDLIFDALSGKAGRVRQICTMNGAIETARSGQAIVLQLEDHLDIGRGSLLTKEEGALHAARTLGVRLVWLSNEPYAPSQSYLLRTAADTVAVAGLQITGRIDLNTLDLTRAEASEPNGIAEAQITLARPIAADLFAAHRATGAFMLVDAVTGAAVAGGIVLGINPAKQAQAGSYSLTAETLWRGLCSDMKDMEESQAEFRRRANEVALILRSAGVPVELEI